MYAMIANAVIVVFLLIVVPRLGGAAIMGQVGHFPTTSGSSWTYAGSGLTMDHAGIQVIQPFTETVTANGGVFHSQIDFSGGNTTTSDNYYIQEDALYIGSTHIVMFSTMDTPFSVETTTTTDNSYAPPQEYFPSELFAGNVETSSSACTTNVNTVSVVMGHAGNASTSSASTQSVQITVSGSEQVTVGAGTFQTVVLSKVLTITEGGNTSTYNTTEWYAEGVGLVKFRSANMNRDLVSYAVNPLEPSDAQISGNPGTFANLQETLDAAREGNVIQARNATLQGAFALSNPVNITLTGGWDSNFDNVIGVTTIQGTLTLEKGSMVVANLSII